MRKLEEIKAYKIASDLSDYVWQIVVKWDWFAKQSLGTQFTKAIDSIAANIAEGHGRFFKKDKIKFFNYAYGSVFESSHWCKKAYARKLITDEQQKYIIDELRKLPDEIGFLVKSTRTNLKR